jgi:hypothetical protein
MYIAGWEFASNPLDLRLPFDCNRFAKYMRMQLGGPRSRGCIAAGQDDT